MRPRRRVPAAGPDARLRAGRVALRRGEAPLREADPDQRPRAARPRALHPVRALHALRRRDRRRSADRLRRARRRDDRGHHLSRRAVHVVLLGQHRSRSARSARSPSSPYRFRARPWDLETVETSCQTCAVGCRGALESTSNRLVRLLGVDSEPVNHGWLCDKGRYGYEWVHSDARVRAPLVRTDGALTETSWPEALDAAAAARCGTLRRRRRRRHRGARWSAGHQRRRVRVGPARQGRARHRQRRRPARSTGSRPTRARHAPGHDRRPRPGPGDRAARPRPRGRAARAPSPGAPRRRRPRVSRWSTSPPRDHGLTACDDRGAAPPPG